ncbi:MAG: hypothetical protein A2V67_04975 [Deltaproteobacteria bacterium RBG_13_61_14]|nr:MAG: hypothetical protein A2V67_04975 [Deltaproteobacteria bacterium RBG_13_61_14]
MRKVHATAVLVTLVLVGSCSGKKPSSCRNPEYAEIKKKQAISQLEKGDLYGALEAALASETCNPRDPETQYWLGRIYWARKQPPKALDHLDKALSLRKDYPEANLALGMVYLELKRWDEAVAQFELVTRHELFRQPEAAYNNLGWAYLMKGDREKAVQAFQTVLKINPNYCPASCNLGEVEAQKGLSAAAIKEYRRALEFCPDYGRARLLLGIELQKQKDVAGACREFQAAVRVWPNTDEAQRAQEYMGLLNCPVAPR